MKSKINKENNKICSYRNLMRDFFISKVDGLHSNIVAILRKTDSGNSHKNLNLI